MPLFTPSVFDLTLTAMFVPLCFGGQIRIIADTSADCALEEIFSQRERIQCDQADAVARRPTQRAAVENGRDQDGHSGRRGIDSGPRQDAPGTLSRSFGF